MRTRLIAAFALLSAIAGSACSCGEDVVGRVVCQVSLSEDHLDFGTIELGQQAVLPVTLTNQSNAPCVLPSITVADDCDGCFVTLDEPALLAERSTVDLEVRFRSVRLPVAMGTVTITLEEDDAQPLTVTLVGRGKDTCRPDLEVLPPTLDFGFVPAGGVAVSSFVIRSTGCNDLLIDEISVMQDGSAYSITTSTPTAGNPGRLAPMGQASVGVLAEVPLTSTGTVVGKVIIKTNVIGDKSEVVVPLRATANLPPIAACGEDFNVEPRDPVELDGSMSRDQDDPPDDPLTYRWRLKGAPPGSTSELNFGGTARPAFFADVSGTYEIELVVVDALGLESEPCTVVVEALPTNAVRIELTWDHPDSDLDLHLIQAGPDGNSGSFCDCATDVHYRDCGRMPNWFPQTPGANPRLDLDDRGGFGPETIDIDGEGETRFIPDGHYRIAVHYFASNEEISTWPTNISNATVRVFVFGLLAAQFSHRLDATGDVWIAGDLVLPDLAIVPIGTVIPMQECGVF